MYTYNNVLSVSVEDAVWMCADVLRSSRQSSVLSCWWSLRRSMHASWMWQPSIWWCCHHMGKTWSRCAPCTRLRRAIPQHLATFLPLPAALPGPDSCLDVLKLQWRCSKGIRTFSRSGNEIITNTSLFCVLIRGLLSTNGVHGDVM